MYFTSRLLLLYQTHLTASTPTFDEFKILDELGLLIGLLGATVKVIPGRNGTNPRIGKLEGSNRL